MARVVFFCLFVCLVFGFWFFGFFIFLPHPEQGPLANYLGNSNSKEYPTVGYLWIIYIHSPVDSFPIFHISKKLPPWITVRENLSLGTVCLQFLGKNFHSYSNGDFEFLILLIVYLTITCL